MKASAEQALNRLCKWRSVFAGWQLGTRPKDDSESDAVRDMREGLLLLRVEVTAIVTLLLQKGIYTFEEYEDQIEVEANALSKMLERRFPGFKATDIGMSIDPSKAAETTKGWRP